MVWVVVDSLGRFIVIDTILVRLFLEIVYRQIRGNDREMLSIIVRVVGCAVGDLHVCILLYRSQR